MIKEENKAQNSISEHFFFQVVVDNVQLNTLYLKRAPSSEQRGEELGALTVPPATQR